MIALQANTLQRSKEKNTTPQKTSKALHYLYKDKKNNTIRPGS